MLRWTVAFSLVLLAAAGDAFAQDVRISAPENMPNPQTGEEGTWIPRWVEKAHVLDAHRLQQCRDESELDAHLIQELDTKIEELEASIRDKDSALTTSLEATISLAQLRSSTDTRLERRTRLIWALTGVALLSVGTSIFALSR